MSEQDRHRDAPHTYEAPAVAWEESFEARANLASACGKAGGSGEPCDSFPSS